MGKKKFDINQLYYIKTLVCAFIRSSFHYVIHIIRHFLQTIITFIKQHKQTSIKLLVPLLIICLAYHACSASKRIIKQDIQEIFAVSDEIRAHYADRPDYWGLSSEEVVKQKIIPQKFLKNNTIVLSSGSTIAIGNGADAEVVMPFSQTFDIILKNLNKAQCISYAEMPLSDDDLIKLYSIHIINTSGETVFEWGGKKTLPISRYATKDLCLDNGNTIIWSIK